MSDRYIRVNERWRAARRILVVRIDNLGDVLVTTPAIHAVKDSLPEASLTLLASPVGAQVGRLNPDLDDVIVYQSPQMDPWRKMTQDSAREQRTIAAIKERRFDGAIIFTSYRQSSLPAAYLCYLADIPLRHAASIDGPGSLLTTRHTHPERMMHEVERGLDLVGALGLDTDERDLVLSVPDDARAEVREILANLTVRDAMTSSPRSHGQENHAEARRGWGVRESGPLVVVHPGCSMPARTYPWEMFAAVVDLLVERLGATVALTGAEDERDLVERVYKRVRADHQPSVLPLAGALSFPAMCALVEGTDLTITNNTGPMHIAAAVKTPVVALFALTNPPEQWGPWHVPRRQLYHDVPCRICYHRVCPYAHECLTLVSPETVVAAAAELLIEAPSAGGTQQKRGEEPASIPLTVGSSVGAGSSWRPVGDVDVEDDR